MALPPPLTHSRLAPAMDQSEYAIGEPACIEIDDQTGRDIKQLHVAGPLYFMDRMHCIQDFDFVE